MYNIIYQKVISHPVTVGDWPGSAAMWPALYLKFFSEQTEPAVKGMTYAELSGFDKCVTMDCPVGK